MQARFEEGTERYLEYMFHWWLCKYDSARIESERVAFLALLLEEQYFLAGSWLTK